MLARRLQAVAYLDLAEGRWEDHMRADDAETDLPGKTGKAVVLAAIGTVLRSFCAHFDPDQGYEMAPPRPRSSTLCRQLKLLASERSVSVSEKRVEGSCILREGGREALRQGSHARACKTPHLRSILLPAVRAYRLLPTPPSPSLCAFVGNARLLQHSSGVSHRRLSRPLERPQAIERFPMWSPGSSSDRRFGRLKMKSEYQRGAAQPSALWYACPPKWEAVL